MCIFIILSSIIIISKQAASMSTYKSVLNVLNGQPADIPPVWIMRQAGRYLPEYRNIRAQAGSFLNLCYTPKYAVEVTLQPIRRFNLDAAILFSDILVIPDALGQKVSFTEGEGPRLEPIDTYEKFLSLKDSNSESIFNHLEPVFETLTELKIQLPSNTTLLGFCGAPWTVASYMIAGQASPDLEKAKMLAETNPKLLDLLIKKLVDVQSEYLIKQFKSGADAVQIFESHAGSLPLGSNSISQWCFTPIKQMISRVRESIPNAPIIVFARGSGFNNHLRVIPETGANAVGVDWSVNFSKFRKIISSTSTTQGNLDPQTLVSGGYKLDQEVDLILNSIQGFPHIFNLGHGITPNTPINHIQKMLSRIRNS